ncbi:MAG TPA: oligosaccharide flippase family protein [Terracidiphilus sp.]
MKSIFRATAILSGSSAVSIVLGLVSSRILASVLKPAGYGYYGLLQSFVLVGSIFVGMGVATGVVRLGATAAKEKNYETMAALCGGAWLLLGALTIPVLLLMVLFRTQLSTWALGTPDHGGDMIVMVGTLLFTVALNLQNGILNAWHRVEALATYGIVNSFFNAGAPVLCVLLWKGKGIAPGVLLGGVLGWMASRFFLYRSVGRLPVKASFKDRIAAARKLIGFGIPYVASYTAGQGVTLAMPMVVVHLLDAEGVGYYKAASAIAVSYLSFLVTAMTQDYYPRISSVREQPQAMVELINEQTRLIMLLAAPVILFTLALVPYIVPLLYSRRFMPSSDILEWQLIGDLFKFSSWTLSYAILARCKPTVYLMTETFNGVVTLTCTWLAVRSFGLQGLGIGFIASTLLYLLFVGIVLRREIPLKWSAQNKNLLLIAVAAAAIVRLLPTSLGLARTGIALALALAFGAYSFRILWREFKSESASHTPQTPTAV